MLPQIGTALRIALVDLLLSADNAVVIALACRNLQAADRRRAYVAGTLGAVALRLLFASGVVFMLQMPFLKLASGIALVVIAIRLVAEEAPASAQANRADGLTVWQAVAAILVSDVAMSLDNVVAVAALADGSLVLLAFGLAMSIPLLVFGSALLTRLIVGRPGLVFLAGMMLGWVAGAIAVTDPAIAPWVARQAPALPLTVPAGAAVLVAWQALILRRQAAKSLADSTAGLA